VTVANGGTINCSGKFNNIKLTMGEYVLNSLIISISMGSVDVVLGVQWLQYLGTIDFNFQELFLKSFWEGKEVELRGIIGKLGKLISCNGMTMHIHKKEQGVVAQFFPLEIQTSRSSIILDL